MMTPQERATVIANLLNAFTGSRQGMENLRTVAKEIEEAEREAFNDGLEDAAMEVEIAMKALRQVMDHQEMVYGHEDAAFNLSWVIADKALKEMEEIEKGE